MDDDERHTILEEKALDTYGESYPELTDKQQESIDADFLNKPVKEMTDAEVLTLIQVMQIDLNLLKKRINKLTRKKK